MSGKNLFALLAALSPVLAAAPAFGAGAPSAITVQGVLRDDKGGLENGAFAMTFKIFGAETGGTELYSASVPDLAVSTGVFAVILGGKTTAPLDLMKLVAADELWIEVTVGSEAPLPRKQLTSAPYALVAKAADRAAKADSIDCAGCIAATAIADGSLTAAKFAPGAIGVADGSITAAKLGAGAVTTGALADGSVTTGKLADGAVTASKLATDAVTTAALLDGSVTASKLAAGAVTSTALAAGSVTAGKLAAGAVTAAALAAGARPIFSKVYVRDTQAVDYTRFSGSTVTPLATKSVTCPADGVIHAHFSAILEIDHLASANYDRVVVGFSNMDSTLAEYAEGTALVTVEAGQPVPTDWYASSVSGDKVIACNAGDTKDIYLNTAGSMTGSGYYASGYVSSYTITTLFVPN